MKKNIKIIIIAACLCLLFAGIGCWFCYKDINTGSIDLTMSGDRILNLEFGQTYQEPGVSAVYTADSESDAIEVDVKQYGQVDSSKPGTYHIKYVASYAGRVATAHRRITITDTVAPVITLTVNEGAYTLPGHQYQEEGFTALDNCDGDVTDSVYRTEQDGIVTYTVTDAAGNTASVQRTIIYNDPEPPVLTLSGETYITMRVGGTYSEAGYSATDNCEGDVTGKVSISGGPDVYQPGTYQIRYSVVDNYGNEATATRTVCVLPVGEEDIVPPTGKVIYLTFDDGPGPHTARLLDVLAKYNVKATFFVVNTGYASTMARAAQEGHTVAMHTASHRYDRIYTSEEAYLADLTTMQSIIEQHTGQKSMLFRFPGGSSNSISKKYNKGIMTRLSQLLTEQGYTYFDWNVDSKDAGGARTAAQVFSNVTNGIGDKSTSVVLQHDLYGFSVDAVEKIIVWGLVNGYTFLPLDASSPTCHHGINN